MGESRETLPTASKSKPTIMVPPRGFLFATGPSPGFSPGPMTLISNYFPEQSPFSFSQLLALASPLTPKAGFLPTYDSESLADKPTEPPPQLESITPLFMLPPGLSPTGLMNSPGYLSPLHGSFGMSHQQALAHVTAQAALSQSFKQMQAEYQHSSSANFGELAPNSSSPVQLEALANPTIMETESSKKELSEVSQSDKRIANVAGDKPASDGYNWRKYGQKQVKASECPRSYYKCTHLNCPVKKKVERSLDGRSEITYKGQHNHDPPKPNKREKDSSDRPANSHVKHVSTSQFQIETERLKEAVNVESEPATSQQPSENHLLINRNDNTKDNVVAHEDDSSEPVAKRRSLDSGVSVPTTSSQQTTSDSKIVLQTRSAVDLLDDGYKWRKYGQKVVKGNSHPRSYYRCTHSGCNVRKHVERASADPKSVITTYEGKHNHDIPVGRYSAANASSQSIKVQKVVSENTLIDRETDYGNRDQMPTTLQLKGEQVAA